MGSIFRTRTRDAWLELLGKADVCIEPVNELPEVFTHPQVVARNMVLGAGYPRQLGFPLKLSCTSGQIKSPAPAQGQHTKEILEGLGYSPAAITALASAATRVTTARVPTILAAGR